MAGTGIFRNDQVKFAWEEESVEGQAESTINNSMGIIKSGIELPDVEYAWDAFFGVGREGRARKDIHEGAQTFRGSVSQIYLLFDGSREILSMCLGEHSGTIVALTGGDPGTNTSVTATTLVDTVQDFSSGGLNVKAGNHAVFSGISVGYINGGTGNTVVDVFPTPARSGTKGWNGPQPTATDEYEIRKTVSVGTSAGNKLTVPTQRLKSMTWAVQHRNSFNHGAGSVGSNLTVNYLGGKVNRATISAVQGEKLSLALDEVLFRDLRHDSDLPSGGGAAIKHSGSTVTPTATFPTEAPMEYSEGTISLFELSTTFARIRNFSLVIDNQLEDSRYLATVDVDGGTKISQIPFEFIEGPRLVTLECEAVMETREYWEHLMRQGQNDALTAKTGFDIRLRFRVDAAAAESFYIQSPPMSNPVQTDTVAAGDNIFSTTAQSAVANVGAVLLAAPHVVGTESENLVVVRLRFDLPNVMFWWDDA